MTIVQIPSETCECCGSENTYMSLEKICGYKERLKVVHCEDCKLSYYSEPVTQE